MRLRALISAVIFALAGCGDGATAQPTVDVVLGTGDATLTIKAEVAANEKARSDGLMGRGALEPDAGMLFVFREPVRVGFWMKDTLIPLDIAFIRDGVVLEVRSLVPCRVSKCPVTYPNATYEQALEVVVGTFQRARLGSGTTVVIKGELPSPS